MEASGGRPVVEFGTRRAHTPEAGVLGARASYIGGCAGTSNTLAGFRYGIPVMVTLAGGYAEKVEDTVAIHCNTAFAGEEALTVCDAPTATEA